MTFWSADWPLLVGADAARRTVAVAAFRSAPDLRAGVVQKATITYSKLIAGQIDGGRRRLIVVR